MTYEVNMQTLGTDITAMENVVGDIRNDMVHMFDQVTEMDSMWDGPANEAFVQQFMLDKEMFEELCRSVDKVLESMTEANISYKNCEEQVGETINSIKIG